MWGEADVPVDVEVADAGTPLHLAVRCGNVAAARALILAGADVSALCGPVPAPPVHRLVEFTLWVDEAVAKLSASAAAAAEVGGPLAGEEAAAAAAHMRSVGARRVALLTRLMKRAGAHLGCRAHSGRTVLGAILGHTLAAAQAGYTSHLIATALLPLFLEGRREAWAMGTSVPLFQPRLAGELALAAQAAERGGAGGRSPAGGKKLWGDGDPGEGASTVLDADSATFVSGGDGRTAGGRGRAPAGGKGRPLDAAASVLDEAAGGGAAGGDDDAAAHRDVPDSASTADDGDGAPKLPATFAHRLDMVTVPGGGGGGAGGPSSPGLGRDALLGASGAALRDGGDGAGRGPSSPYAVAAAVGLTGAYDGESGARDERDLVCELMPEGWHADAEGGGDGGVGHSMVFTLAIEVLNAMGGGSSDLWADALQHCLLQVETEPETLPPPPPTRVDAYRLV